MQIPVVLLFDPFQKGYVKAHERKGKMVASFFTKRPPATVNKKHTKERFHDHSNETAKKAHNELEEKKKLAQTLLDAAEKHHDELTKKGPPKEEGNITHKEKISHLKAEIKNQQTHIDNHTRKQDLIKNRYEIDRKRIVAKKSKADLEKKLKGHTESQQKTIKDIHDAHQSGKSKLEPGKILKGDDKDHIYIESKHKDTGEKHHIAIHKDGSIKDPNILHDGKFDAKSLKDTAPKKVVVKKEMKVEKPKEVEKEEAKPIEKPKPEAKKVTVPKEKEITQTKADIIKIKEKAKVKETKKTKTEEHKNRSEAMKGNKNAFKGGPKDEPKKTSKQLDQLTENDRTGKETNIITARSKDKHKVRYKVIDANDDKLIASNHIDGKINKDYPQLSVKGALQMRDRSNIQSKSQITQMSNDIEPMFLTDSKIASDGAPIVGGDYKGKEGHSVVESGNGRVMALRTAYDNGKADHYKQHLVDEAKDFGIDPDVVSSMKNPILVRERVDKLSDEEKAKFAKESNKSTVSQMTAVEQATEDSNYLGSIANLKATESGRITHKNNSQFIQDFFSSVMDDDQREIGKLLNKNGQLNDEGERRLTNAVFVNVYGANSDIMNKLIMKDTDQTKKITAGMLAAAPRMAKFKSVMEKSDRHDLDISSNVIDALTAMEDLKRSSLSLEDKLKSIDMTELGATDKSFKDPLKNPDVVEIFKLIREHGSGLTGSSAKVASLLTNYADEAEKVIYADDPRVKSMEDFMGVPKEEQPKVTKKIILSQAKDEVAFKQADRKGKQKDYESYLEKYPKGKFAGQAKESLEKLKFSEQDKRQASF